MSAEPPAYGLWSLVIINVAVFAIFAFSFTHPRTGRDWRSFGAFTAFLVALFTEMYGFPVTIYLLSGWLQQRYPGLDLLSHNAGHLWETLLGWRGDPHLNPLHLGRRCSHLPCSRSWCGCTSAWRAARSARCARSLGRRTPATPR